MAALLLVVATAGTAQAATTRTYGRGATIEFVEFGPMSGAPGNAHASHLEFSTSSDGQHGAYGYIFHYQCPTSFVPSPTDVYAEAVNQLETECTFFADGTESLESGDLTIRMTGDQQWTKVTGYFDASLATQPVVEFDLRFRGYGSLTETETVNRGPGYKQFLRTRARAASVSGTIAGVSIGDAEPGDRTYPAQMRRLRFLTYAW